MHPIKNFISLGISLTVFGYAARETENVYHAVYVSGISILLYILLLAFLRLCNRVIRKKRRRKFTKTYESMPEFTCNVIHDLKCSFIVGEPLTHKQYENIEKQLSKIAEINATLRDIALESQ